MGYDLRKTIDSDAVNALAKECCAGHKSIRVARENGANVMEMRGRIIEMLMPSAYRVVASFRRLPRASRVQYDDMIQSAMQGMIEGVDSFEPDRGNKIQTHIWYQIRYRVMRGALSDHWVVMRPPQRLIEKFMCGNLEADEYKQYVEKAFGAEHVDEVRRYSDE